MVADGPNRRLLDPPLSWSSANYVSTEILTSLGVNVFVAGAQVRLSTTGPDVLKLPSKRRAKEKALTTLLRTLQWHPKLISFFDYIRICNKIATTL